MNYNDIYPLDKIYSEKLGVAFSVCGAAVGGDSPAPGPGPVSDFTITDGAAFVNALGGMTTREAYPCQNECHSAELDCTTYNMYIMYDGENWFMPDFFYDCDICDTFYWCDLRNSLNEALENYTTGVPVAGDEIVLSIGWSFDDEDGDFPICEGSTASVLHNQTVPEHVIPECPEE